MYGLGSLSSVPLAKDAQENSPNPVVNSGRTALTLTKTQRDKK